VEALERRDPTYPCGRLWRLVAEAALLALELVVADKALVRCGDFKAIQLVKRLNAMADSKLKQRAEVGKELANEPSPHVARPRFHRCLTHLRCRRARARVCYVCVLLLLLVVVQVFGYMGRLDEAEACYRDLDRKDLAVDLRVRVGDWFKVASLIQTGGAGDDKLYRHALTKIGDYYGDRRQWDKALHYFISAKQLAKQADCL